MDHIPGCSQREMLSNSLDWHRAAHVLKVEIGDLRLGASQGCGRASLARASFRTDRFSLLRRSERVSAYPACAQEVESAGGSYASVAMTEAVVDGMLVTAPAWPGMLSKQPGSVEGCRARRLASETMAV